MENKKYLENFNVDNSNRFTYSAICQNIEKLGSYNPLYIYGEHNVGKTHLLKAFAIEIINSSKNINIIYNTIKIFEEELKESIRNGTLEIFLNKYKNVDVLLLDDINEIKDKIVEDVLIYIIDYLYIERKQMIFSGNKPPKDMNILNKELIKRLELGLLAGL